MDVVVTGRHCQVSEEFREHVIDRVSLVEKLRERVIRIEVEVSAGGRTKQPEDSARVEITLISKGPAVRGEASAQDKMAAFEQALEKLRTQLRRALDRRKVHRGRHRPISLAEVGAELDDLPVRELSSAENGADDREQPDNYTVAGIEVTGGGPLIVREKTHAGKPMSLAKALDRMELLGHDFYLFVDEATFLPSVVYRRRHYDYGVIRLDTGSVEQADQRPPVTVGGPELRRAT